MAFKLRCFQNGDDGDQRGKGQPKPTFHHLYLTCATPGDVVLESRFSAPGACPRRKGLANLAMLRAKTGLSWGRPSQHQPPKQIAGAPRERGPHPLHAQTMPIPTPGTEAPSAHTVTQGVGVVPCLSWLKSLLSCRARGGSMGKPHVTKRGPPADPGTDGPAQSQELPSQNGRREDVRSLPALPH